MSNRDYNGGRGGLSQGKSTSKSQSKFGGSHASNPGKAAEVKDFSVGGSHAKNSRPNTKEITRDPFTWSRG